MKKIVFSTTLTAVCLLMIGCTSPSPPSEPAGAEKVSTGEALNLPRTVLGTGADGVAFVAEETCAGCHQEAFQAWSGSHHDLAMQSADEKTVLGNFSNAGFEGNHGVTRFFRKGDGFYVNTAGPDGVSKDYRITHTFGATPLQQYLVALPGGALHSLTIAWDTVGKRWFELEEDAAPGSAYHWSGRFYRWNDRCAECHATNLKQGYQPDTRTFATTWAAEDVGCQACHGPGQKHLEWAAAAESERAGDPTYGLVVSTSKASARQQVEDCAPCHSRRHPLTPDPVQGQPLLDNYMPALLREGLYHADGQIQDEVFVYGSYIQSKMHRMGVACTDCHDPHTLKPRAPGNDLCLQCHNPAGNPRFPSLVKKNYNDPTHHFHQQGAAGSNCVDCHMPATVYMGVDPRRDHSMRIPRPDLTVSIGTPNACQSCHADRTPEWALASVEKWYGPETSNAPHYGKTLARTRRGEASVSDLQALAEDTEQPSIVRATALEHLGPLGGGETIQAALTGEDDLIRAAAARSARFLAPEDQVRGLFPLLDDPVRAVRIAAAINLAGFPAGDLEPEKKALLDRAVREYERAQQAQGDQPEPYLNLGVLYSAQAKAGEAEAAYLRALDIEPDFLAARINLGNLYNRTGRNDDALAQFRNAAEAHPGEGDVHYSLGLLLAEMGDYPASATSLERAAALLPNRSRVHFNLGKILTYLGRGEEGEQALLHAHKIEPISSEFIQELLKVYMGRNRWQDARTMAMKLDSLYPNDPGIQELLRSIQKRLEN
ncbi:MAG: ammonia-forming cytochrome c nitrite reductase subunit c552 [Acidobacteriota bacterium]|nr:ammonia-forming cytochrome c nitrite reductase subunit c552 [Acidobacteriota bacterium]